MNDEQIELEALQAIEQAANLPDMLVFWYVSPDQYEPNNGPVGDLLKSRMSRREIADFEAATAIRTSVITWGHEQLDAEGNPPPAMLPLIALWNDPIRNAY